MSSPTKAVADAADKSGGSSFFRFDGRKRTGIDHVLRKSGAFDTDDAVFRLSGDGNDIEVNGGGEHLPIVVVGMVAADFASSGYRENGKLVATALLNVCGTNGGIHEVATVNEYRNKGYATALIKHIIKESKKLGCDILSLQASVFGEPVYKKLGFNVVSSILNYKL